LPSSLDAKYRKHTRPYKALNIAFLPVIADTPAVRLLYHCAATVKASGDVDNEGLIERERVDHRFGFRRATIFRRHQAELGLLLAALGAQHCGGTTPSTSSSPFQDRGGREGEVVTVTYTITLQ